MKNRLLTSVTALMLTSMAATSQIMHAVVFCDTDDAKIGKAVEVDHDNLIKELECYATFIDYDICLYEYSGEDCSKGMLLQSLDELEIAPEDIVVFCYSGHGTRAMNNENDPFPQMCLGSSLDSEFVPLQFAINKLNAKNPKLLVSFTNCCNKESDMVTIKPLLAQANGPTSLSEVNTDAFKKLFAETSGQAIITSSKAGEYSWCSPTIGGLFITDLLDVLYLVGQDKIKPTWEDVFENARAKTAARTITTNIAPYKATQTPYYKIVPGDATPKDDKRDKGTDNKDKVRENDPLAASLNDLVDKSLSTDARLGTIPFVLSKYFAANGKVRTLGRNGMTVDYEPAQEFLRRIVLSRRIAKIAVVKRDGNDKHKEISIHEINN